MADIIRKDRVFIIAEVSANHGQDFDRAVSMIHKAKECGADAVKFQAYTPDTMTLDIDRECFMVKHPEWGGRTLYDLYKKASMPWEWLGKLKNIADDLGIVFFATAFDRTSVDYLEELDVPFHKLASFELVDLPLIEYMSKKGKPVIFSTGMASFEEIKEAVHAAGKAGAKEIILLKCVSAYPAEPADMNLRTMFHMERSSGCAVGLSDHTLGMGAALAAVSLGACVVEKHFTLSRNDNTPDSFFSIEPDELKELVQNIRTVEKALGTVRYGVTKDQENSRIYRRSLFAVEDIKEGEIFTENNVRSIRPANGMPPKYFKDIMGKKARIDIKKGTPMEWGLII